MPTPRSCDSDKSGSRTEKPHLSICGESRPFSIINELATYRRLLTVAEVAALFGKSACTIYRAARRKQIPSLIISGSRSFDPATLAMWLAKKDPQLAVAARLQSAA
jgi:predicted DNA-binding transcriptional regulator AlpA